MAAIREIFIPPMSAQAFSVSAGELVQIVDTDGGQPGDFVAFNSADFSETFSQCRTRVENRKLWVGPGDDLWTSKIPPRRMFHVEGGSASSRHDLIYAPCCRYVLRERFGVDRDGCFEKLAEALSTHGIPPASMPDPLNLFFQVDVDTDGRFHIGQHGSSAGERLVLRALMDCLVAISTCSVPIEGRENSSYRIRVVSGEE